VAGRASPGIANALLRLRTVLVTTTLEVLFSVIVVVSSASLEADVTLEALETAGTVVVVNSVTVTWTVLIAEGVVSGQR
jgi:hypothetical protein